MNAEPVHQEPRAHQLAENVRLCSATGRDITLAYRSIGHESSEALVLFPGVNTNMEMYHPDFVAALAAAGPFRVLQIDMRDVGFSTKLDSPRCRMSRRSSCHGDGASSRRRTRSRI
jgi:pimeloyl-ACP methyl ester carboxylesterase